MEKIIKQFVKSDLTESKFFGLSKENLINLKEYLTYLYLFDEEFEKRTKPQLDSIKKKCDWVKGLNFNSLRTDSRDDNRSKMMELVARDNINVHAVFNQKTDMFERNYDDLYFYRFSKRKCGLVSSRQEDLLLIQDELKESCEIGKEVYKDITLIKDSASERFSIWSQPNGGIFIATDDGILAAFPKGEQARKEKTYLNDKNKSKILKMIQLENPFNF